MSSSPPPVVKKPRPKPKPRHAAPPSDTNQLSVTSEARGAGPSRSPSLPGSQGRLLSSSSKTPASRTPSAATPISIASSPEPQAIAATSQKKPSERAVRRSSRPTNSFLKRDVDVDAAAAQPTWVTADNVDEEDGEEEIDELEPSSLESVASGKGKGKGKEKGKGRSMVDEEKEEEERRIKERQDEDERRFNAQFQRKPRGWLDKDGLHKNKEIGKGKGKASSKSRSPGRGTSAQVISDSDDEMAAFDKQRSASDDDDDSEDGGVGRAASKKRNRAPAGTQKKRKLVHDWSVKDTMSESSESDSDFRVVGGKTKKANVRGGGGGETKPAAVAAREKSASLTPPPELDPMILLRVNNQVRSALADDHPNPLLERDGQASESDDDDDFDFNVPAPRQTSPPPPARHVNARAGPSRPNFNSNAPIVLDDSDDEVSASPAPTQAPVRQRNAKTFDAPMSVKIKVKVISHHDRTKVSERAVAQFEKKKVYHLDRFDTLGSVFDEVAADCGYPVTELIVTNDSKRIYRSTMVDTLGIYDEALFIGYRKDIYEAEIKRKKDEEEARLARLALEAASQEDPNDGAGGGGSDSDDSSNNDNNNNNAHSPAPLPPTQDNNDRRSHSAAPAAGGEGETKLRLTLRGPHGEAKFMVKTTTKISSLIKNYGSKRALAKEVWEKLRVEDPDGEMMDNEKTVGDYEVEDDDMLSVT